MRVLVGKTIDLVFNAWAVARAHALDHPGEHRAAVEAGADDLVRLGVGVGDPAWHLPRVLHRVAHEAEHRHRIQVTRLLGEFREIDAAPVQARRCAGLEPALRELELLQARRQRHRGRVARPAARMALQADVNLAVQEGAGGQHHGPTPKANANLCDSTHDTIAFNQQVVDGLLEQAEVRLVLQPLADRGLVQDAVGLGPGRSHRRPLGAVEDAELNPGFVGGSRHGTAQGVDFLHQMALANATDRRVATHLPQGLDVVREQQRARSHARSRQRGLGAGMATADDDHVEFVGVQHGNSEGLGHGARGYGGWQCRA